MSRLTTSANAPSVRVTAIIAAGGSGRRVGGPVPKQLLELGGRSLLQRSVEAFTSHPDVSDVIVAVPADVLAAPPSWSTGRPAGLVAGGERGRSRWRPRLTRAASVRLVIVPRRGAAVCDAEVIECAIDGGVRASGRRSWHCRCATRSRAWGRRGGLAGPSRATRSGSRRRLRLFAAKCWVPRLRWARLEPATDEAMLAEQAGHPVRHRRWEMAEHEDHDAADASRPRREAVGDPGRESGLATTCIGSSRDARSCSAA